MYFSEVIMYNIAEGLGIDVDELRLKNLYKIGEHTPFLQYIDEDWHVPLLLEQLRRSAEYEKRKKAVEDFNAKNRWKKRGICLIPTKFGLSFATALHLNQGAAYVKIYHDGSVLLHHGGTEMGQGLFTKMCQIAAQELGTPLDAIFTQDTSTYQIANASPTAASSGSDLNGMAVKDACDQLNERLKPYREKFGKDAPLKELVHAAYLDRVNLAANGFWKMPRVGYKWGDYDIATVKPMYYYFTQGAGCSEVEVDLLTGDSTVLRTDLMMVSHDFSPSRTTYTNIYTGRRQLHQPRHRLRPNRRRLHPRPRPLHHGRNPLDALRRAIHPRPRHIQDPWFQRHPTGLQRILAAR
jgi:xanthine dehydrogenase/oxidase